MENKNRKKIGLALGSGSSRGLAHIGVLNALDENDIPVDFISGASIGALIGVMYAFDKLKDWEDYARKINWKEMFTMADLGFSMRGLFDGQKIYDHIIKLLGDKKIEEARIPFRCVATDILTGEEIRFKKGNVADAIRASISIPGIFTPFKKDDRYLVDGGIVNPVPVNILRKMGADFVIAVDLNHDIVNRGKKTSAQEELAEKVTEEVAETLADEKKEDFPLFEIIKDRYKDLEMSFKKFIKSVSGPNIFDIISNATCIMQKNIGKQNLQISPPDVLIRPELGYMRLFDFDKAKEAIEEGHQKAMQQMDTILQALSKP